MSTETNQTAVSAETDAGEGSQSTELETIAIPKKDYDSLNQTVGSLKRELKDLKKSQTSTETPTNQTKADESALLQKLERISLRQAGLTHQDDIDLARATAKKWGMDIDEVLLDEDFKVKLEKNQTKRSNEIATSDIKGGQGPSQAKNTPEYWMKLGRPPSREEVTDRKVRAKIARSFMSKNDGSGMSFYNE